jgi:hypothetical protein
LIWVILTLLWGILLYIASRTFFTPPLESIITFILSMISRTAFLTLLRTSHTHSALLSSKSEGISIILFLTNSLSPNHMYMSTLGSIFKITCYQKGKYYLLLETTIFMIGNTHLYILYYCIHLYLFKSILIFNYFSYIFIYLFNINLKEWPKTTNFVRDEK